MKYTFSYIGGDFRVGFGNYNKGNRLKGKDSFLLTNEGFLFRAKDYSKIWKKKLIIKWFYLLLI